MLPMTGFDGVGHLALHFVVGNVAFILAPVVREVAQMDEHREGIVLATDVMHVVLELSRVHLTTSTTQQADDVILQSLEIHLDIGCDGIVGSRRGPVAAATATAQSHHHAVGVEHRQLVTNLITVVPLLQVIKVHAILLRQGTDLVLGETEVPSHLTRFHHGVFLEVVQARLRAVLLDRKNACHINTRKDIIGLDALEHTAQPVHILVHH